MTRVGPNAEIAAASSWRVDLRGVVVGIEPRLRCPRREADRASNWSDSRRSLRESPAVTSAASTRSSPVPRRCRSRRRRGRRLGCWPCTASPATRRRCVGVAAAFDRRRASTSSCRGCPVTAPTVDEMVHDALGRLDGGGRPTPTGGWRPAPSGSSSSGSRWAARWRCGRRCTTPTVARPGPRQPGDRAATRRRARDARRDCSPTAWTSCRASAATSPSPAVVEIAYDGHAAGAADLAPRRRRRADGRAATAS